MRPDPVRDFLHTHKVLINKVQLVVAILLLIFLVEVAIVPLLTMALGHDATTQAIRDSFRNKNSDPHGAKIVHSMFARSLDAHLYVYGTLLVIGTISFFGYRMWKQAQWTDR